MKRSQAREADAAALCSIQSMSELELHLKESSGQSVLADLLLQNEIGAARALLAVQKAVATSACTAPSPNHNPNPNPTQGCRHIFAHCRVHF